MIKLSDILYHTKLQLGSRGHYNNVDVIMKAWSDFMWTQSNAGSAVTPRIAVDFSTQTGLGHPFVFGEEGSPSSTTNISAFTKQGFTLHKLRLAINVIVPSNTTLADYKANKNGVSDSKTWDFSSLQKLEDYYADSMQDIANFMVTIVNIPSWLSSSGKISDVPRCVAVSVSTKRTMK